MINQMNTILLWEENIVFLFYVDSLIGFVSGSFEALGPGW